MTCSALLDDQPESVRGGRPPGGGREVGRGQRPGRRRACRASGRISPCPGVGRRCRTRPRGARRSGSRPATPAGRRAKPRIRPAAGAARPRPRPTVPAAASSGPAGGAALAEPALPLGVRHCPLVGRPGGRGGRPAAVACCFAAGSLAARRSRLEAWPTLPEKKRGFFGPRLVNGTEIMGPPFGLQRDP